MDTNERVDPPDPPDPVGTELGAQRPAAAGSQTKVELWAQWAEIAASLTVVITLVLLVQEVRRNTRALQRQADVERAVAMTYPFFENPGLADVLDKIKAVDGQDPVPRALMEHYGLTGREAILWERHLLLIWQGLEADYEAVGESPTLGNMIRSLWCAPDNRLYLTAEEQFSTSEFREYVTRLRATSDCEPPEAVGR